MTEHEPIISTNSIRENARAILDQSHDILTLDYNSIENVLIPTLKTFQNELGYVAPAEKPITFQRELGATLFMDVVNFCFKNPESKNEYSYTNGSNKVMRSQGLFTAIKEAEVDWNNLISVAALSPERWKDIAQLSSNQLYLGEERGAQIRGFAKQLTERGFKSVIGYLNYTKFDTNILLASLSESGYFTDEFLKRAQLTVRMLDDIFKKYDMPGFKNTKILTAMADYRIPQVFYNEGAVKLNPDLLLKLLREEPIKSESSEERALRASVIVVAERLSKIMGINEGEVDTLLWTLSQKMAKEGKLPIPHMLVATDKY